MLNFYFPYAGNKRLENKNTDDVLTELLESGKIKYIVEPFCGSCSFSFHVYRKYGDKFQYIMNDTDKHLIGIYKVIQDQGCGPLFDFANEKTAEIYKAEGPNRNPPLFKELIKKKHDDPFHYFFWHRVYHCHKGAFYMNARRMTYDASKFEKRDEFVKKCKFSCLDYSEFLKEWEGRGDVLIMLDPPYFQSHNGYYWDVGQKTDENGFVKDYTCTCVDLYNFMKTKTPSILVTNYVSIIDYIFKEFFKKLYGKTYMHDHLARKHKKKKTQHAIYVNF